MEIQKIVNLLNGSDNENSKSATKKWYVIDSETKGNYSPHDQIKFLTSSLESSFCDYSDGYMKFAFKNCAPFRMCRTEINETFIDEAEHINITMTMYNLIEYNDNYSDTSGSLWQFQRDEIEGYVGLTVNDKHIPNNSSLFKCKSNIIVNRSVAGTKANIKIAVPLKYLSNFWRLLEMPLINCKVEISLKCILSSGRNAATFAITDKKLQVPVVTLKSEDNAKLSKLLNERFKRSVYWNKYKAVLKDFAENNFIREQLDASFQGINRLFVLAYARGNNVADEDSYRRYFLPSSGIKNYDIEIDARNFYD